MGLQHGKVPTWRTRAYFSPDGSAQSDLIPSNLLDYNTQIAKLENFTEGTRAQDGISQIWRLIFANRPITDEETKQERKKRMRAARDQAKRRHMARTRDEGQKALTRSQLTREAKHRN